MSDGKSQCWKYRQKADCYPVRFLDLIKPFTPLLPEVAAPESKVPFNQKMMWTGVREHFTMCPYMRPFADEG